MNVDGVTEQVAYSAVGELTTREEDFSLPLMARLDTEDAPRRHSLLVAGWDDVFVPFVLKIALVVVYVSVRLGQDSPPDVGTILWGRIDREGSGPETTAENLRPIRSATA